MSSLPRIALSSFAQPRSSCASHERLASHLIAGMCHLSAGKHNLAPFEKSRMLNKKGKDEHWAAGLVFGDSSFGLSTQRLHFVDDGSRECTMVGVVACAGQRILAVGRCVGCVIEQPPLSPPPPARLPRARPGRAAAAGRSRAALVGGGCSCRGGARLGHALASIPPWHPTERPALPAASIARRVPGPRFGMRSSCQQTTMTAHTKDLCWSRIIRHCALTSRRLVTKRKASSEVVL